MDNSYELEQLAKMKKAKKAKRRRPTWKCQECGAKFSTLRHTCPKCASTDIDLNVD
jgi:uncharacterized OB-fold protein